MSEEEVQSNIAEVIIASVDLANAVKADLEDNEGYISRTTIEAVHIYFKKYWKLDLDMEEIRGNQQ
jgi:hypothetical protein